MGSYDLYTVWQVYVARKPRKTTDGVLLGQRVCCLRRNSIHSFAGSLRGYVSGRSISIQRAAGGYVAREAMHGASHCSTAF